MTLIPLTHPSLADRFLHDRTGRDPRGPTTDSGWTPLFMTTAGLVTETGSPVAHGPTVAREYGIPAVICVRNATSDTRWQWLHLASMRS